MIKTSLVILLSIFTSSVFSFNNNDTAIFRACKENNAELVSCLLKEGTDISIRDSSGNSPLHIVVRYDHFDLAKLLLERGANPNMKNNKGQTPIHRVVSLKMTELLISYHSEINTLDVNNQTPLFFASASDKRLDIVKLFVQKGGDINVIPKGNYYTPLHVACWQGCIQNVKFLLDNGANPNITIENKDTPIIEAAYKGFLEIVQVLVDKGADINIINVRNITPIYYASSQGKSDIVECLASKNANLNVISIEGKTALDISIEKKFPEVTKILERYGAKKAADMFPVEIK